MKRRRSRLSDLDFELAQLADEPVRAFTLRALVELKFGLLSGEIIKGFEPVRQYGYLVVEVMFVLAQHTRLNQILLENVESASLDVIGLHGLQLDDALAAPVQSVAHFVLSGHYGAVAVLLVLHPGARVRALVRIHVNAETVPFVQLVETFVPPTVRVLLDSEAIDLGVSPISRELPSILEMVGAEALNDSVFVIAGVVLIVGPLLNAISILFACDVVANEDGAVGPGLLAHALLHVLSVLALEAELVHVSRDATAVVHIIGPLSFIRLTLDMSELAVAVRSPEVPSALVSGSISEAHFAAAMTEPAQPLSFVSGAAGAIPVRLDDQLLRQLCLIGLEEEVQVDKRALRDGLQLILCQKMGGLLSPLVSPLVVAHSSHGSLPVSLDTNDPIDVAAEVVIELVARPRASSRRRLRLHLVGTAALCERVGQFSSHR